MNVPRLIIAGTHSGVGKTSVAVGLMAALSRRGMRVAPFKVGPDFLDPGYHAAACGHPSPPLDTWMLGEDGVLRSFASGAAEADVALIEGMMGLHDGASAETDDGSTAEVARLLRAPVIRENVLASYVHLHFGSNPTVAEHFVSRCLAAHGGL